MQNIVLVIHVIIAVSIVGFILIQQGKGAEAGASFGAGASQTILGSTGSWNFFSKVTALLATGFFVTSISLAIIAKQNAAVPDALLPAIEQYQEQTEQQLPAELPVLESEIPVQDSEIPSFEDESPIDVLEVEQSEIPEI